MDFDVITATGADNFDRFWVRMQEVRESLRIIEQCCARIEPGPVRTTMAMLFRPPPGESYVPIEAPKGELGFYLVSDGTIAPYRCHIRSPSFINLRPLQGTAGGLETRRRGGQPGQPRLQYGRG